MQPSQHGSPMAWTTSWASGEHGHDSSTHLCAFGTHSLIFLLLRVRAMNATSHSAGKQGSSDFGILLVVMASLLGETDPSDFGVLVFALFFFRVLLRDSGLIAAINGTTILPACLLSSGSSSASAMKAFCNLGAGFSMMEKRPPGRANSCCTHASGPGA